MLTRKKASANKKVLKRTYLAADLSTIFSSDDVEKHVDGGDSTDKEEDQGVLFDVGKQIGND